MVKACDMSGCKPVRFQHGKVHVRGGRLHKDMPMTTTTVNVRGKKTVFVKLGVREAWMITATTGQKRHQNSSICRTSLLQLLHNKKDDACNGAADIGDRADEEGEHDPMADLDVGADVSKTKSPGKKRNHYYQNHAKNRFVVCQLPQFCPEAAPDCTLTRDVTLYVRDRKTIWICIDDVEWAIRYLYAQNMLKGVPLLAPNSRGPGADDGPSCAGTEPDTDSADGEAASGST